MLGHHLRVSELRGLPDLVEAGSPGLLRTTYMLTGDLPSAEDLVQSALVRT